jgi:hypothetical protein
MLIKEKMHFIVGIVLTFSFFIVLFLMFSPIFSGNNALKSADNLFNSISKGSIYYIPDLIRKVEAIQHIQFKAKVKIKEAFTRTMVEKIKDRTGLEVKEEKGVLELGGSLGSLLLSALKDCDAMFKNQGKELSEKYGLPEKEVMFSWWTIMKDVEKDLKKQEMFKEASYVEEVIKKGVELSYNYYKIEARSASSYGWILGGSLVFYVVYTLWWGLAIFYLFEGLGLKMEAGVKKEV